MLVFIILEQFTDFKIIRHSDKPPDYDRVLAEVAESVQLLRFNADTLS